MKWVAFENLLLHVLYYEVNVYYKPFSLAQLLKEESVFYIFPMFTKNDKQAVFLTEELSTEIKHFSEF